MCVSAPTGSGKTLAYVLPIIEVVFPLQLYPIIDHYFKVLSTRLVTRLRALVVLPTRDLVIQVRETFEALGKGHGLKVCLPPNGLSPGSSVLDCDSHGSTFIRS